MVRTKDIEMDTVDWVFERDIVDYRIEEVLSFTKNMNSHTVERKFDKERSVFKPWVVDTEASLKKCME